MVLQTTGTHHAASLSAHVVKPTRTCMPHADRKVQCFKAYQAVACSAATSIFPWHLSLLDMSALLVLRPAFRPCFGYSSGTRPSNTLVADTRRGGNLAATASWPEDGLLLLRDDPTVIPTPTPTPSLVLLVGTSQLVLCRRGACLVPLPLPLPPPLLLALGAFPPAVAGRDAAGVAVGAAAAGGGLGPPMLLQRSNNSCGIAVGLYPRVAAKSARGPPTPLGTAAAADGPAELLPLLLLDVAESVPSFNHCSCLSAHNKAHASHCITKPQMRGCTHSWT